MWRHHLKRWSNLLWSIEFLNTAWKLGCHIDPQKNTQKYISCFSDWWTCDSCAFFESQSYKWDFLMLMWHVNLLCKCRPIFNLHCKCRMFEWGPILVAVSTSFSGTPKLNTLDLWSRVDSLYCIVQAFSSWACHSLSKDMIWYDMIRVSLSHFYVLLRTHHWDGYPVQESVT